MCAVVDDVPAFSKSKTPLRDALPIHLPAPGRSKRRPGRPATIFFSRPYIPTTILQQYVSDTGYKDSSQRSRNVKWLTHRQATNKDSSQRSPPTSLRHEPTR